MFGWTGKRSSSFIELESGQSFDSLLSQELSIVFKHSHTCPISGFAYTEVQHFHEDSPDTPVYLVSVRRQRSLSLYIEERTGIQHESPQIIVFRNGRVAASASHEQITADLLQRLIHQR